MKIRNFLKRKILKGFPHIKCILIEINVRPCNSKNLNQSPFCEIGNKYGPLKWAEEASNLYNKTGYIPEYVRKLKTSLRNIHGTRRLKEDEIFTENIEVQFLLLKNMN